MATVESKLRVLVVDDTVIYRKVVSGLLAEMPDVEVVGTAANGKIALDKIESSRPDLLLLDVEMPEIDGMEVLRRLRASGSPVGAIMLSALTTQGAQTTVQCLEWGAFDFVLKPAGANIDANLDRLRGELRPRLSAYARRSAMRAILERPSAGSSNGTALPAPAARTPVPTASATATPQIVAIGISTGGPKALAEMLPALPGDLPVPVVIVQHMPPVFTRSLAEDLDRRCALKVEEACDGRELRPGLALIAPGGKQMQVVRGAGPAVAQITDDPPENSCRPSVDYLFRSVSAVYGARSLGVIMTGMGNDGAAGCRAMKGRGARIIAQDAASCVVFGMPRQPIEEGTADMVVPLNRLAAEIARLAKGRP